MQALFQEFGHAGPCCYYTLMEMCTEKFELDFDGNPITKFRFSEQIVRRNLHISRTNLENILNICQTFGLLSWKKDNKFIEIEMPMLLNLLDRDMKKPRKTRAQDAQNSRLELELELELEEESIKEKPTRVRAAHPITEIWNENCGQLPKVQRVDGKRLKLVVEAWKLFPEPEFWVSTIRRLSQSYFCTGNNDKNWIATFDWFFKPGNYEKVSEGNYDNRQKQSMLSGELAF